MDGVSFLPTLLGKPGRQKQHDYLYWEHPQTKNRDQAVRMGKWKGVYPGWRRRGKEVVPCKLELYDLGKDPGEQHDVAAEHPEVVAAIETIMREAHTIAGKKVMTLH